MLAKGASHSRLLIFLCSCQRSEVTKKGIFYDTLHKIFAVPLAFAHGWIVSSYNLKKKRSRTRHVKTGREPRAVPSCFKIIKVALAFLTREVGLSNKRILFA